MNQKIEIDSLSSFPMNRSIIFLDTGYYSQTYVHSDNSYAGVRFNWNSLFFKSLFTHLVSNGHLDSVDILKNFKLDTIGSGTTHEEIIANYQISENLKEQLLNQHRGSKWNKKKLYNQKVFSTEKKKEPSYTCSNPFFFKNNEAAVVYVSVYYKPHIAQGYIEYYEIDNNNEWHLVERKEVWMS